MDGSQFQNQQEWLVNEGYDLNLLFGLSVDWYQEYTTTAPYSVGVMYLTVLNLPRELRMSKENIFILGKSSLTKFYLYDRLGTAKLFLSKFLCLINT